MAWRSSEQRPAMATATHHGIQECPMTTTEIGFDRKYVHQIRFSSLTRFAVAFSAEPLERKS
jgi:hypothetical protein